MTRFIRYVKVHQSEIMLIISIVLVAFIGFNLGKFSAIRKFKTPITITESRESQEHPINKQTAKSTNTTNLLNQPVIASKNSKSKLYHFAWCRGALKIANKNKITFTSETAAITAGYSLAGNCQK